MYETRHQQQQQSAYTTPSSSSLASTCIGDEALLVCRRLEDVEQLSAPSQSVCYLAYLPLSINQSINQKFKVNSAEHCSHIQRKLKIRSGKEREKRYVMRLDLNVDSVVDDVTCGGREFHVRDAAAGKARSPIVRRPVEGTATAISVSISHHRDHLVWHRDKYLSR